MPRPCCCSHRRTGQGSGCGEGVITTPLGNEDLALWTGQEPASAAACASSAHTAGGSPSASSQGWCRALRHPASTSPPNSTALMGPPSALVTLVGLPRRPRGGINVNKIVLRGMPSPNFDVVDRLGSVEA